MATSTRYKLSELAPLLCPGGDERAVYETARRIQNWVTAGLLRPVGRVHSGRGVHRRYDRHELGKAAVLLELHRYHMPARVLELVAGLFDDARRPRDDSAISEVRGLTPGQLRKQRELALCLQRAWHKRTLVYLTLHLTNTGDIRAELGTNLALSEGARSMVAVDLTEILSALP